MISLIVARSNNNVIGVDNKIPWNIKGEPEQLKRLTTNNVVIMGRKTFESIGHPLKDRVNIVVTSKDSDGFGNDVIVCHSVMEAISYARKNYIDLEIFVIGGYRVFEEVIPYVDKMFITEINMYVESTKNTVYFPEFDESKFRKMLLESHGMYKRYAYIKLEED